MWTRTMIARYAAVGTAGPCRMELSTTKRRQLWLEYQENQQARGMKDQAERTHRQLESENGLTTTPATKCRHRKILELPQAQVNVVGDHDGHHLEADAWIGTICELQITSPCFIRHSQRLLRGKLQRGEKIGNYYLLCNKCPLRITKPLGWFHLERILFGERQRRYRYGWTSRNQNPP